MRRTVHLIATVTLAALVMASPPARAQGGQPPQAWLFGAWTGGLFPPPSSLGSQECLAQPVVIFTRDTDTVYSQRSVETARITADGVEFRFAPPIAQSPSSPFGLSGNATTEAGFGCVSPEVLQVQRRSDNEISFPGCTDFPYPLVRCPGR
jgi:hypothetical protein